MNEFEWRRQMRDLRGPLTPNRDLWASIEAMLNDTDSSAVQASPDRTSKNPTRWLMASGLAASIVLAGFVGWHAHDVSSAASTASTPNSHVVQNWKPADPRLTGAATQLNAARAELQQAIDQSPNSPALQRLLIQTERQQSQLRELARDAG